jgi:hypothetical protein
MTRALINVRRISLICVFALGLLTAVAVARTVAPSTADRAAIIKAFGDPPAASPCLSVRLAASGRSYATVRPSRAARCVRWAFDGTNVIRRVTPRRWRVVFEGSSYRCPLANIPRSVQRDLGVCQ